MPWLSSQERQPGSWLFTWKTLIPKHQVRGLVKRKPKQQSRAPLVAGIQPAIRKTRFSEMPLTPWTAPGQVLPGDPAPFPKQTGPWPTQEHQEGAEEAPGQALPPSISQHLWRPKPPCGLERGRTTYRLVNTLTAAPFGTEDQTLACHIWPISSEI